MRRSSPICWVDLKFCRRFATSAALRSGGGQSRRPKAARADRSRAGIIAQSDPMRASIKSICPCGCSWRMTSSKSVTAVAGGASSIFICRPERSAAEPARHGAVFPPLDDWRFVPRAPLFLRGSLRTGGHYDDTTEPHRRVAPART